MEPKLPMFAKITLFIAAVMLSTCWCKEASGQSLAPYSSGYAAKIAAQIRANIDFTEQVSGDSPRAIVEVRTDPTGLIVQFRLLRASGVASWDAAVLRAIEKTKTIPRDVNGSVSPVIEIEFRPRD